MEFIIISGQSGAGKSSAASFLEVLRREGWTVRKAKNDVLSGIRLTADALKAGRIVICDPCADAIREFGSYCWDLTAGGFVLSGEDPKISALRELEEEMGLALKPEDLRFVFTEPFSYVLDDYFLARAEADPAALTLQEDEVADARWFSLDEVTAMIADGRFVDYPIEGIRRVFALAAAR